jgi:hypothetical protein
MTRSERSSQVWAVLAWAARNRQTLTYSDVSKLIGVPTAGLGPILDPIYSYCLLAKLPPLTILVVQKESGLPGPGFPVATAGCFIRMPSFNRRKNMTNKTISHLTSIVAMISLIQGSGGVIAAVPANADSPINAPSTQPVATPTNLGIRAIVGEILSQLPNHCPDAVTKDSKEGFTEVFEYFCKTEEECVIKIAFKIKDTLYKAKYWPIFTDQCEAFFTKKDEELKIIVASIEQKEREIEIAKSKVQQEEKEAAENRRKEEKKLLR